MTKHDYTTTVAADSTGTTTVAFIGAHLYGGSATVDRVVAEQTTNADAEFNVELGGSDIFSSEQSVASGDTPAPLSPDQNRNGAGDALPLAVDVSTAAAAADDLMVTVTVDDNKEE